MLDDLRIGWNVDLDILSALRAVPVEQHDELWLLISMVDSTPHVRHLPSLIPLLDELAARHAEIGDDVCVRLATFFMLAEARGFFTGFDEVWVFNDQPAEGKPEGLRLTSDHPLLSAPAGLQSWMQRVGCVAGLGDGYGLNFATFNPDLARRWEQDVSG